MDSSNKNLFQKVASLWTASSISKIDSPSSTFSLFSPILSVLLLFSAPSFFNRNTTSSSDYLRNLFDWTLENQDPIGQEWFKHQRCPARLSESFSQGLLKKVDSLQGDQKLDLDPKDVSALIIALRMREAIVKAWPLIGFPKVISPLGNLTTHFQSRFPSLAPLLAQVESRPLQLSPSSSNLEPNPSASSSTSTSNVSPSRGLSLFQSTYSKHSSRVLDSLGHSHPSLPSSALNLIYQPLLSDDSILNPHPFSTSLICLIICLASGLEPQAKGHFGGAKNCVRKNLERKEQYQKGGQEAYLEGVEMDMVVLAVNTTALLVEELKLGPTFGEWDWLPDEVLDFVKELEGSKSSPSS